MTKRSLGDLLRQEHSETPAPTTRRVPTKADLEAKILQLEAALADVTAAYEQAQAELAQLKAAPPEPMALALPDPQLTAERTRRERAEQDALQLAQINTQLLTENAALKKTTQTVEKRPSYPESTDERQKRPVYPTSASVLPVQNNDGAIPSWLL